MNEGVVVYVELLDEGTTVWRPTTAYRLDEKILILSNENYHAETETWAVSPGSLITIEQKQLADGPVGVAKRYEKSVP